MSISKVKLGENVVIGKDVEFNVTESLVIGDRSKIGDFFKIEGRNIEIGREFWSGSHCVIGGGSCFEKLSSLKIGDLCHLGDYSFINTARAVKIGDEVGLGQNTRIYTHGVYQNFLKGFPCEFGSVTLEDRVWCPNAMILPNVTIGHDTVVGAGAVVTESLPSNCLAVGVPAKVIKPNCYPKEFTDEELAEKIKQFIDHFNSDIEYAEDRITQDGDMVLVDEAFFDLKDYIIEGSVSPLTERFKNELRRYGVRFRYYAKDGVYVKWL